MPRIVEYANRQNVDPEVAAAGGRELRILGEERGQSYDAAFKDIGGAIKDVGEHVERSEISDTSAKLAQLDMQMTADYEKAKSDPNAANDPNFAQNFLKQHSDALDKVGDGLLTQGAQDYYQRASQEMKLNFFKQTSADQALVAGNKAIADVETTGTAYANGAALNPTATADKIAQMHTALEGAHIPAQVRPQLEQRYSATIADSGAEGYVAAYEKAVTQDGNMTPQQLADQAQQVKDVLATDTFQKNMTPGKYASLLVRLDTARASRMSAQSSIIDSQMPSVLKQVETFGDNGNAEEMIKTYQGENPAKTTAWQEEQTEKLQAARAIFPQRQAMQNMSAPEMDEYIQKLRTSAGSASPENARAGVDAYNAAMEYKKQRDDEFYKDPAAYEVKNNQTIGMLSQRFQSTQDPADFAKYAQFTLANQAHLEPDAPGHLATPEMKGQWRGLAQQITTGGAPVAQQAMAKGAEQYGQYWPRVSQELMEDKIITGPQFVAASMYGKPNAYGVASDVLTASVTPWKDLKTTGETHGVSETDAVGAAATALAPFERTLRNVANGPQLISAYRDALSRTLLYRGDTGGASDIAGKMIADAYQMHDSARIPNWQGLDTGKVEAGLDAGMDKVDFNSLVVPPSASGLGPNDQRTNYIASVKSTGKWYTNGDESGVTLYDAANHNVLMKKGNAYVPVTLTWKDLETLGEQHLSPLDRVGRFFTQKPQ